MSPLVSRTVRTSALSLCMHASAALLAVPLVGCGSGTSGDWSAGTGSSGGTASSGGSSGGATSSGGTSGGTSGGGASSGAGSSSGSGSSSGARSSSSSSGGSSGGPLDPGVAPGGNFDLSTWELDLPINNQTIPSSQLQGPNGYHDSYFFTDPTDGSMTFWDPENGQTTPNSNYPRSELREVTPGGQIANWAVTGTHTLSATLQSDMIPDHVCVGQIHCGTGTPSTSKPLLELFYFANGDIQMGIEASPAGMETLHPVTNVPLGTQWSYVISLTGGNTIGLVVNGGTMHTWTMPSSFDQEGMYFKAGDYDQSNGSNASVGAKVQFYALKVLHGP